MDEVTGTGTGTVDRCPTPMALLRRRVPLSLLLDLAFGPDSAHVLATEPARRPRHGLPAPRSAAGWAPRELADR